MNDITALAILTNDGPDRGLDQFLTDDYGRDDLAFDIRLADRIRQSTWRDETLDDDEGVVIAVVEEHGAWWATWRDATTFSAEGFATRAAAEARYEQWMTRSDWLDYGPPSTTDVDGVETVPDGFKVVIDDDGNRIVVPR